MTMEHVEIARRMPAIRLRGARGRSTLPTTPATAGPEPEEVSMRSTIALATVRLPAAPSH